MDKKALWISTTRKDYWTNKEIPYGYGKAARPAETENYKFAFWR